MADKVLEVHPSALDELESAITWYLERDRKAAVTFAAEVDRATRLITEFPARWPTGKHSTRRFVLRRFPFAIVYREKEHVIQVLAVAHGHRRPYYWKDRL